MCHRCNYTEMLKDSGLGPTENRVRVLEIIGENNSPLSAEDIFNTIARNHRINRVTVYRVLKLLSEHRLIEPFSNGRSFHYGMAPSENHPPHPHFFCKSCGKIECLNPESMLVDTLNFEKIFPGKIDKLEIRVEGICKNCIKLS
jgi:Fe2+ or Zn2+ uptake regulation protein